MTAPVTLSWKDEDFTMRFFVPSDIGSNYPVPTSDDVTIVPFSANTVAVLTFGGCKCNDLQYVNFDLQNYKGQQSQDQNLILQLYKNI